MSFFSRRSFLKVAAKASALGLLLSPLQRLAAFAPRTEQLPPSWKELVEYARWCPTVHNLQPHKLKIISESEAELFYDPVRLLPVGDPQSIFATVALGVFVEHLSIAAAPHGYRVELRDMGATPRTDAKEFTRFGRLHLITTSQKEPLDRDLFQKRRTSRIPYDGRPLEASALSQLMAEAERTGHRFFSSQDPKLIERIIAFNQQTLFEDLESEADRKELDHLFRYTREEAKAHKDGLWAECMGFPGRLMRSVFRHHKRWSHGLRKKLLARKYRASFKGTSTFCWFASKFDITEDWFQAGRMLARTWLTLTREGACIQPFGSLITNKEAYRQINEMLLQPEQPYKIWMLFRAGYSKEPARSFRLSTDEIIIS